MGCRVVVILGALFCAASAFADESAFAFLQKAASHASQTNYYGICSYHTDDKVDGSFKFAHFRDGVDDKNIIETLSWSTPLGKSFDKKHSVIVRRGSFLARLDRFIPELAQAHYDLRLGQEANIADHKARVLYVIPKDAYRYAHQFWVDEKTGLLLGYRILAEENKVIEEVRCHHLKAITRSPLQSETWDSVSNAPKKEALGFVEKVALPRYFPGHDKPLTQLFFTDGFTSFSVFIENSDVGHEPLKDHFSRFGATAKLTTVRNGYKITAVGEVPKNTLEKAIETILASGMPPAVYP